MLPQTVTDKNKEFFGFRLEKQYATQLREYASDNERTASNAVIWIVKQFLDENKP